MIRTCPSCAQKNRVPAAHLAGRVRCGSCKTIFGPVDRPLDADADLLDDVLRDAKVPVLVDFWADWCRPCHMAAPEVQRVAADMAGRALVLKIDTERHPGLAARYGVQGIPTFTVISGGRTVRQQSGVVDHAEMMRWLEAASSA